MEGINTNIVGIAAAAGGVTTYNMIAGQTTLTVGTELTTSALEIVFLSASVADELLRIKRWWQWRHQSFYNGKR